MTNHYTSAQVCALLGISAKTLYLWERSGKIPMPARDRRGWRVFSERQLVAIRRHAGLLEPNEAAAGKSGAGSRSAGVTKPAISARNQLHGTVVSVSSDGILSEVVLRLPDGQEVVAVVTRSSVRRLGIRKGQGATAIIKATEVMLAT
ncbi:MAG TPA: TOBE domain-containing protein [Candidatus Eisenbacteria bacterium]